MELPVVETAPELSLSETASASDGPTRSRLCDCVGVVCSCACAVHCAAMPFVIGWLPALGLSWLADEGFHQWVVGLCFLLAVAAVLPGYRHHRRIIVPLLAIGGVSVLATGAFALQDECCQQYPTTESEHAADIEAGTALPEKGDTISGHRACCEEAKDGTQCSLDTESHSNVASPQVERSHESDGGSEVAPNVVTAGVLPSRIIDSSSSTENAWLNWLSRLLTPLGGVLLVSAHLMNRRCCDCCEGPA